VLSNTLDAPADFTILLLRSKSRHTPHTWTLAVIEKRRTFMNFNFLSKNKKKTITPSTKVYRKQIIEGFSIPAIIQNGSYFFVDIDVYENGRVECWNFEDFEHFKKDVQKGWVSLNIPDKKEISIHGLGNWTIQNGNWIFNKDSFIEYVQSLIKNLNPKLENIYKHSEKTINGVRIGESGNGTIYKDSKKDENDIFPEKINGNSINLFYRISKEYALVKVNAFADHTIQLSRLESPIDLTLEEFEKYIEQKDILTEIPLNSNVSIYGLGDFKVTNNLYVTSVEDKLLEIKDILGKLNGQPSTIEICRKNHKTYINNPIIENKNKLKASYENIPIHQRMYVGDMDTEDIEVRMIIYGEKEIENWSHYQIAKSRGEKLPTINIPKPKDKNNS
jgi:hypothetical protein